MNNKKNIESQNNEFDIETNSLKALKHFFSITDDDLKNVFHVLPSDSEEEARKKILNVVYKDEFLHNYFDKDSLFWELKNFEPGMWTTPAKEERVLSKDELIDKKYTHEDIKKMRLPIKESSVIQTVQEKLTVKFVRKDPKQVLADPRFIERVEKQLKEVIANESVFIKILKNKFQSIDKPRISKKKRDPEKLLLIPDVELHLGKLASKFDSIDSYDYKKALYRYIKVIHEAQKVQERYNASQIVMTIGNDFFNTDTEQNTTTAGTEQHNDTRFQQMIANGVAAHIWAIEKMKNNCDKLVLKYHPGNHDFLTDFMLYMTLFYMYRDDPKVEISDKIKDNRWWSFHIYKDVLMIFVHGKTPEGRALKDSDLGLLPYKYLPEESRNAKSISVHAGHLHITSSITLENGVNVYRNGSLSGDGAWDSGNLYSSDKSHQVYVYNPNVGVEAIINIKLNKEELEKGIKISPVTEDTEYIKTIENAISNNLEEIILEEAKKLNKNNEKQIALIEKKYQEKIIGIESLFNTNRISEEQKNELLNIIGYTEEISPYLETRAMLSKKLGSRSKKLSLRKKSY